MGWGGRDARTASLTQVRTFLVSRGSAGRPLPRFEPRGSSAAGAAAAAAAPSAAAISTCVVLTTASVAPISLSAYRSIDTTRPSGTCTTRTTASPWTSFTARVRPMAWQISAAVHTFGKPLARARASIITAWSSSNGHVSLITRRQPRIASPSCTDASTAETAALFRVNIRSTTHTRSVPAPRPASSSWDERPIAYRRSWV
mmetsp:Transcript_2845/g.8542  ORF Transcript_2845/g.8542 Transcript_2845/m.8542 type:complete len:201 (-) Transcript_2845:807-1409(-)